MLRHRDFQIFWTGAIISHIAGWMRQVAQAWLVYELTGSALLVGLNGLFSAIPFIGLSFYAGTVIDRLDRRKLLIWLELATAIGAAICAGVLLVAGRRVPLNVDLGTAEDLPAVVSTAIL